MSTLFRWKTQRRLKSISRTRKWGHMVLLAAWVGMFTSPSVSAPPIHPPKSWSQGALGKQVHELQTIWSRKGETLRLKPKLVEQGESIAVLLPDSLLDKNTKGCVTVASLASPNISFILLFQRRDEGSSRRSWPVPSAAGIAEVTRCGARKPMLAGLRAQMRSQRGVLEFLVVSTQHPPPQASEKLRGRNSGPSATSPHVGKRPHLSPLKMRLAARSRQANQHGADSMTLSALSTDETGRGSVIIHLSPGCHQLQLLTEADPVSPPDLDARLSSISTDEVVAVDEEHSGEVSLVHCVGRAERSRVDFSGAPPHVEVSLLHGHWKLPQGLPKAWGPVARANLARSIWQDGLPPLYDPPVYSVLGVRGSTHFTIEVDPSACYFAALAPIRGKVERLALASQVGGVVRQNQASSREQGTSLGFCALGNDRVKFETRGFGSGLAWLLGVWRMSTEGNSQ